MSAPPLSAVQTGDASLSFFDRNTEERAEIIEGLIREGQLATFAGAFGMGKSPMLADLTVRLINGLEWCGRKVVRRPVIVFDFETPGPDYKKTIKVIAARLGVPVPLVPEDLYVYLEHDSMSEPGTTKLLAAMSQPGHEPKLKLIQEALTQKPNAVVIVDPFESFFRLDTTKKVDVLLLYHELRILLAGFQKAAMLDTFNLRKQDRRGGRACLLSDPRNWLEEVCGSLDLLNRSDVRLGIDAQEDDVRVINGIIRGQEMHPILIRPVQNADEQLAGFERVSADQLALIGLSAGQRTHWDKLPREFKFEDIAGKLVPRSTLSRLIKRTISLGALSREEDGVFRKLV